MRLRPVDIDEVWPRIAEVASRVIDGDDMTAENIRAECREGRSLCLASADGVVVGTLVPDRLRGDFEFCVVLAVSVGKHGMVEEYLPEVDGIARELGASRIVFYTRRRGWERRLGPEWRLRHVAYVREVAR